MYDRSTADRINGQIAAETNAKVAANIMRDHNIRAANRREAQINKRHQLDIKRLQDDYRWQTKNVENVKGTASTLTGEMQVAIDIIMELTGKSFEQVKKMIIEHHKIGDYCNKAEAWFKTSPQFEGGLISDSRQAVSD